MSPTAQDRRGYLGGTDAKRLIEGDWLAVYKEKIGESQGPDLSGVFRVQLGVATEQFHLDWLHNQMGVKLRQPRRFIHHPQFTWMGGHLDAWCIDEDTFLDTKHSSERADARYLTEWYQPQIAHYCLILDRPFGLISCIAGNTEPFLTKVEPTREYLLSLMEIEQQFWWCVENKMPPDGVATAKIVKLKLEAPKARINGMRLVDMRGNNEWANQVGIFLESKPEAERHDEAKAAIKKLIEADVAEAFGHGVTVKRDKKGSLRFTINT